MILVHTCLCIRHFYLKELICIDCFIFQNVSFKVKPGEVVALVGPSGGGKSSCINLLEHYYEPVAGQVLLDGKPVQDYDHKFLHTKVKHVL